MLHPQYTKCGCYPIRQHCDELAGRALLVLLSYIQNRKMVIFHIAYCSLQLHIKKVKVNIFQEKEGESIGIGWKVVMVNGQMVASEKWR